MKCLCLCCGDKWYYGMIKISYQPFYTPQLCPTWGNVGNNLPKLNNVKCKMWNVKCRSGAARPNTSTFYILHFTLKKTKKKSASKKILETESIETNYYALF